MKMLKMASVVAGLSLTGVGVALAAPGYVTANVNLRTGPDTAFPSMGVIPDGAPVHIEGCLNDESWCDVDWRGNRGWVYSTYLMFSYEGQRALVPDWGLAAIGIPIVAFAASDYWNRHYIGRPWYADRARWYGYTPQPRPGWRPPPPGPRPAGWWQPGYNPGRYPPPPPGMGRPGGHGRPGPGMPPPNMGGPGGPGRPGPGMPPPNMGGTGGPGRPGQGNPPPNRGGPGGPGRPGQGAQPYPGSDQPQR